MGRNPPPLGGTLPSKGSNSIFFFSSARGTQANQARPIARNKGRYPGAAPGATRNSPDSASSHDPSSRLNLRQSPRHILPGVLIILQLSREITFVRTQVEVAVPAEAEQDDARPPFLAGEQRFVHRGADEVVEGL